MSRNFTHYENLARLMGQVIRFTLDGGKTWAFNKLDNELSGLESNPCICGGKEIISGGAVGTVQFTPDLFRRLNEKRSLIVFEKATEEEIAGKVFTRLPDHPKPLSQPEQSQQTALAL